MGCLKLQILNEQYESSGLKIGFVSKNLRPKRTLKNAYRGYLFGFQGQEKDNEIKGIGNSLNYKYRMYDSRLGRFFAVDPLASKYPHNSPYAFSENVVIHAIELEGLEKVVLFGGADIMSGSSGDGLASTTIQIKNNLELYSKLREYNYTVSAYPTMMDGSSIYKAYNDIKATYKEGETIMIYGYSMGGVAATQLTKLLKSDNIQVKLLVTVDAAWGPFSRQIEVPDNVEKNINYFQTSVLNPLGSSGFPSKRMEGNDKTEMVNYNLDKVVSDDWDDDGKGAHGHMDEITQEPVIIQIEDAMQDAATEEK